MLKSTYCPAPMFQTGGWTPTSLNIITKRSGWALASAPRRRFPQESETENATRIFQENTSKSEKSAREFSFTPRWDYISVRLQESRVDFSAVPALGFHKGGLAVVFGVTIGLSLPAVQASQGMSCRYGCKPIGLGLRHCHSARPKLMKMMCLISVLNHSLRVICQSP